MSLTVPVRRETSGSRLRRGALWGSSTWVRRMACHPVNWDPIVEKLGTGLAPTPEAHNARTKWLATINEDGSPHVTAFGALWLDGTFWFQTGVGTRKSRNIALDPALLDLRLDSRRDVVVEGEATRVTDPGPWRALRWHGPPMVGRRNPIQAVRASPPHSTPHRRDRRRGSSIVLSHARPPWSWERNRAV